MLASAVADPSAHGAPSARDRPRRLLLQRFMRVWIVEWVSPRSTGAILRPPLLLGVRNCKFLRVALPFRIGSQEYKESIGLRNPASADPSDSTPGFSRASRYRLTFILQALSQTWVLLIVILVHSHGLTRPGLQITNHIRCIS